MIHESATIDEADIDFTDSAETETESDTESDDSEVPYAVDHHGRKLGPEGTWLVHYDGRVRRAWPDPDSDSSFESIGNDGAVIDGKQARGSSVNVLIEETRARVKAATRLGPTGTVLIDNEYDPRTGKRLGPMGTLLIGREYDPRAGKSLGPEGTILLDAEELEVVHMLGGHNLAAGKGGRWVVG
ncbi:hypothetical protein HWV62_43026 [Athelia sp. TMB]|nr:hypothetical protein HWV62_43026 [Athelia sp. TMB]